MIRINGIGGDKKMNMIETMHLSKEYSDFAAVSDINLHIRKGTVYGFLGPNGAGKSTTMKMFLGLTRPSSGSFTICLLYTSDAEAGAGWRTDWKAADTDSG